MELKIALEQVRQGKIIFDNGIGMKYFLFMAYHDELYYVHAETINKDKMEIAVLGNRKPNLLAEGWWKNEWDVWEEDVKDQQNEQEKKNE